MGRTLQPSLPAGRPRSARKRLLLALASTAGLLLALVSVCTPVAVRAGTSVQPVAPLAQPDTVCAQCHQAIVASYERTPMAMGSGLATAALVPGSFTHAASGVDYRVFLRDGAAWFDYSRGAGKPGGAGAAGRDLEGEEQLRYFIGSGKRGRTYLFARAGQWYELPINFYTRRARWDMAPALDVVNAMPGPLPTDAGCLHCHATGVATPEPTARNRFAGAPFAQGGVGCSACHGDPAAHLAANGHGPIVNPDKLSVARRDSSCLQCHLEGDAVVFRAGRSLAQFRAGDDLAEDAVYFVRASQANGGARATSQYEALLQSACRRAVGDRLTCTSCHDPHASPAPAERVAYFRARCLSCHSAPAIAVSHYPEQPDCASCHMPSRSSSDISHEQVTDHNIEARPAESSAAGSLHLVALAGGEELVPVGNVAVGDREQGLAYAQMAQRGDRSAGERALRLLTRVEASAGAVPAASAASNGTQIAGAAAAPDHQLHLNLGFLEQLAGQPERARLEYAAALRANPYEPGALADMAVLDASSGRVPEAVRLLDRLVMADAGQTAAGLDLAFIECRLGQVAEARTTAERVRAANPDSPALRQFLRTGEYAGQSCRAMAPPVLTGLSRNR